MEEVQTFATRTEWVEDQLRWVILSGQLAPGERIQAETFATRWGISQTPVREACNRLAAEGLVELLPHRGVRVAELSAEDLLDTYRLRLLLEPLAFKLSLQQKGVRWADTASAALRALEAEVVKGKPRDWEVAHTVFHQALIADCGSRLLLRTVEGLRLHSIRWRLLSTESRGGPENSFKEHHQMLDAALQGDDEQALRRLSDHLKTTFAALDGAAARVLSQWSDSVEKSITRLGRSWPIEIPDGIGVSSKP